MCEESKIEANMELPTVSELIPDDTLDVVPVTTEPTAAELADIEAEAVIRAVEPILKKCKKKKVIRPKSINLFKDQPLNVKLENGVVLTLNFAIPEN